jgi:arylsulfatase
MTRRNSATEFGQLCVRIRGRASGSGDRTCRKWIRCPSISVVNCGKALSAAYSFNDPGAAERHTTQYFEMFGNRGIYHKGWAAVTKHRTPWLTGHDVKVPAFDDVWELYDTSTDWAQAHDLAKQHPDRLHQLQRLWLIEAVKYNVVPLDDRFAERGNPEIAGRPQLIQGNRQVVFGGTGRLNEWCLVNTKNKSFAVTVEVDVPRSGAEGVLVALGGISGGWSLYAREGKPKFCYNFFGLEQTYVEGARVLPEGTHQVRMEFAYDGGGLARGGTVTLYVDGQPDGSGHLERTEPFPFSGDETLDLGDESGSPVTTDYGQRAFTGEVRWAEIDVGVDDHDHLISPDERFRVAMARQ